MPGYCGGAGWKLIAAIFALFIRYFGITHLDKYEIIYSPSQYLISSGSGSPHSPKYTVTSSKLFLIKSTALEQCLSFFFQEIIFFSVVY